MMKSFPHNIILIGYRGTGKSRSARELANRLGWTAVDADEYLESKYGQSIRDIFATEGEPGFRDKETAVLKELFSRARQVLATGGGAVLREENRALLKQSGFIVWLTARPEVILRRISADPTTAQRRPALTPMGELAEIEALLAVREPLYRECANLCLDTSEMTEENIREAILATIAASS